MSAHFFPSRDQLGDHDFVDDDDESLNRFGSVDGFNRYAHLAVNTSVIAAITGFPTDACEEFHHTLFYDDLVALWPQCGFGSAEHAAAENHRAFPETADDPYLADWIDCIAHAAAGTE